MIEYQTISISERCKELFDLQDMAIRESKIFSLVSAYSGFFSQDLVNGFSIGIEENLISSGEKKQIIKRIFSILIEGLQNIRVHGKVDESGKHFGSFIFAKSKTEYKIIFGSLTDNEEREGLTKRIDSLNKSNLDEVKELYMNTLMNGNLSLKGNAGLGFITMRLKSKAELKLDFYEISENLFYFTIKMNVRREN